VVAIRSGWAWWPELRGAVTAAADQSLYDRPAAVEEIDEIDVL
jgi:hypothetical protein